MTNTRNIKKLRLGVLLSGGGRTLLNLHELMNSGELPAEVAVVIASRQCKGVSRCSEAGMNVNVIPYKEMPDLETYSAAIAEMLDNANVDLVLLAGFLSMWIIPDRYAGKVLNIHPALLPSFGGKGMFGHHVHEAVVAAGCKISGCTVHFVTNEYDSGPILIQKAVAISDSDSPEDVAAKVFDLECQAYPEAIGLIAQNRVIIDGNVARIAD